MSRTDSTGERLRDVSISVEQAPERPMSVACRLAAARLLGLCRKRSETAPGGAMSAVIVRRTRNATPTLGANAAPAEVEELTRTSGVSAMWGFEVAVDDARECAARASAICGLNAGVRYRQRPCVQLRRQSLAFPLHHEVAPHAVCSSRGRWCGRVVESRRSRASVRSASAVGVLGGSKALMATCV